jgi:hypothetical protein
MKPLSRVLAGSAACAIALGLTTPAFAQGDHHRDRRGDCSGRGGPVMVDESAGTATVTVRLRRAVDRDVTFRWSTRTRGFRDYRGDFDRRATARGWHHGDDRIGRATGGKDFTRAGGKVTIEAGSRTATVSVPIIDDSRAERSEIFLVAFRPTKQTARALSLSRDLHHGDDRGDDHGHRSWHRDLRFAVPVLIVDDDGPSRSAS